MPGVSIALATFNGEKHLAPQLQSLARQTQLPTELIISDDCSNDRTVEIARSFAGSAPFPVRIICNESRLGYRDNFMHAVEHCGSELIAYCDQDDIWEPQKLAVVARVFEDPDVLLAYHNATLIDADGNTIGRLYKGGAGVVTFPPLTRHPWLAVPGFTQVFRRELTRFSFVHPATTDVDWPGERLAHDRWYYFLASVLGCIAFVGQPLARYRQHEENVFGVYTDRRTHFDRLMRGERFIRTAAITAENRSNLLKQIQNLLPAEWHERSLKGIAYYDALQQRLHDRTAVYASPSYWARLKALYALFRQGAYGRAYGSARFSLADLLMDTYLAVPLGPNLRRVLGK